MTRTLFWLAACALVSIAAFMTLGARGSWDFVLVFRGTKLIALVLVGTSVALSTVLFQTLTANRILTPSIMGFDSLYMLLQTALVFAFGGLGYASLSPEVTFVSGVVLLTGAALLLFGTLLGKGVQDLFRMLLVGVVFGVLFRSLTSLLQRLIDPNEFAVLQGSLFASFNRVDTNLLAISTPVILVCTALVWNRRHALDVMALGREQAIGLGLNHRRELFIGLTLVSVLVAVSTALVGPIVFFGLLVSALAYEIMKTHRHGPVFAAAVLISICVLVGGQAVFERLLGMSATLSVVIEFLGGLVFLFLILRKARI